MAKVSIQIDGGPELGITAAMWEVPRNRLRYITETVFAQVAAVGTPCPGREPEGIRDKKAPRGKKAKGKGKPTAQAPGMPDAEVADLSKA